MPVIHFHHIGELTIEQKRKLASGIAQAVHEATNVPKEYVPLWLHRTEAGDHAIGETLLGDMIAAEQDKKN